MSSRKDINNQGVYSNSTHNEGLRKAALKDQDQRGFFLKDTVRTAMLVCAIAMFFGFIALWASNSWNKDKSSNTVPATTQPVANTPAKPKGPLVPNTMMKIPHQGKQFSRGRSAQSSSYGAKTDALLKKTLQPYITNVRNDATDIHYFKYQNDPTDHIKQSIKIDNKLVKASTDPSISDYESKSCYHTLDIYSIDQTTNKINLTDLKSQLFFEDTEPVLDYKRQPVLDTNGQPKRQKIPNFSFSGSIATDFTDYAKKYSELVNWHASIDATEGNPILPNNIFCPVKISNPGRYKIHSGYLWCKNREWAILDVTEDNENIRFTLIPRLLDTYDLFTAIMARVWSRQEEGLKNIMSTLIQNLSLYGIHELGNMKMSTKTGALSRTNSMYFEISFQNPLTRLQLITKMHDNMKLFCDNEKLPHKLLGISDTSTSVIPNPT